MSVFEERASRETKGAILFVSHTGKWGGGGEVVLGQLMSATRELGFGVLLGAPKGDLIPQVAGKVETTYHLPIVAPRRTTRATALVSIAGGLLHTTLLLVRIVRREQPVAIYANSGAAAITCAAAAVVTKTPLLWHQHDIIPRRRVNRLLLRPLGRITRGVIAVSAAVSNSLFLLGIPREKVSVLHNAVREEFFERPLDKNEARAALGLPDKAFIAAMAGRLVPYKGHELLLEAVGSLRRGGCEVVVAIAGAAPEYPPPEADPFPSYVSSLRHQADEGLLCGHVFFLGRQEDSRLVLAAADVLVSPSRDEPFPLIILEAMAAGVPVLASDSGGQPEAIESGVTGLLFPSGDADALAERLRTIMNDRRLRTELTRKAAEAAAANFSQSRFAQRLASILGAALAKNGVVRQ